MITLTEEQNAAVDYLLSFPKPVMTLGGLAGTGKSTVMKELSRRLPSYAVLAYTGKAANVLRRKGIDAATIHSRIYALVEDLRVDVGGRTTRKMTWDLVPEVPYRGFLVDESSMVSKAIHEDLLSFGLPIIYVGDHGQLEPVEGKDFNLMKNPDVTLEEVHRNAGEIAQFAYHLRQGCKPRDWMKSKGYSGRKVRFTTLAQLDEEDNYLGFDQIICAFNDTRVLVNRKARAYLGYPEDKPVVGDRVICLKNSKRLGIFNGMQGTIAQISMTGEILFRSGEGSYWCPYDKEQFNNPKRAEGWDNTLIPFDYSYAITCHKAQGDEFDNVLVLNQRCRAWDNVRWMYTAASRAKESLTWVEL